MIEAQHDLSVRRQCEILKLARSGVYRPISTAEEDLTRCKELDNLHLEFPAFRSRKLSRLLKAQGQLVNRKRVQRLMRSMGIEALAPKPRTSEAAPEHTKFPYLLRHLDIVRPNQVWASDITYIPTRQGHCYLVAVMDWYTRQVLSWRISNTMDSRF
jgi:putative transposase